MLELAAAAIVLLLVAAAIAQARAARADRRRLAPDDRLVAIAPGVRLHVRCAGAGGPVVLLDAGIAATSLSWSRVQPLVAEFARVCSYDRAGLGWSDPAPGTISAAAQARHLSALVTTHALPPPYVLVGHSYGSFVVLAFAAAHPSLVAGIVLVDPVWPGLFVEPSDETRRRLRGAVVLSYVGAVLARIGFVRLSLRLLTGGAPRAARGVSRLFGSEASAVLSRLVGEVQKLPPEAWPSVAAIWSQPKCFVAMARHFRGLAASAREVAACGTLGDIPLTVVTGGLQPDDVRAAQLAIATLSRAGRQIVAPRSAHWVHLDEPEIVASAIRDLVERWQEGARASRAAR